MKKKNFRKRMLFISFMLLPVTLNYFSPYLIIDGLFNKVLCGAFIVWSLFFVTSLVFGRAACAYICPYGGLQMTIDSVINKPLKEVKFMKNIKTLLGVIWGSIITFALAKSIDRLNVDIFYNIDNYVTVDSWQTLVFYYVIVVALSILPFALGKRATCHYLCPMSILNILGTKIKNKVKWPSLHLEVDGSKCVSCGMCSKVCPMTLNVKEMVRCNKVNDAECILCGECVSACNKSAIQRTFRHGNGKNFEINRQA